MVFNLSLKILMIYLISFPMFFSASAQIKSAKNLTGISSIKNTAVSLQVRDLAVQKDSFILPNIDSVKLDYDISNKENKINLTRLGIVSGATLSILGGLYYRMKTAWWNDGSVKFHFDYNYSYVDNVDKVGHLYGGALISECFGVGLKWAGFDDESSLLYGAVLSTLVYTGIEIKDGFGPDWGFDVGDIGSSTIGSFYPYLQKKISFLQNFNFKYSYYPSHSNFYENMNKESNNNQFFNDDYEGETFWLSTDIKNLLPEKINSFIPDFLYIACGVSVEHLDITANKHRVFILSPDIDLTKLFKTDNEFLKNVFRLLNYIHIPLPAIQVSPNFKGYVLYLKP